MRVSRVATKSSPRGGAKLLLETLCQLGDVRAVRFDHEVRDFAIDRVAKLVQLVDTSPRIGGSKQRPVLAVPSALPEHLRGRVQIQHGAVLLKLRAVSGAQ